VERHFTETRRFFQLPQAFKEEMLVDGNSRQARASWAKQHRFLSRDCKPYLSALVPRDSGHNQDTQPDARS